VGATLLLAGLPLVAGAGLSVQQALNGRVALRVGPLVTTFVNFVVGALGLSVALLGALALPGHLAGPPDFGWLYVGGPLGIVYIWLAALLVRVHGVLVLGMAIIAGQVVTAVVIEWVTGTHVGPFGYLAAVVVVAGVTVAVRMKRQA
jgi:transporter family-2 protein